MALSILLICPYIVSVHFTQKTHTTAKNMGFVNFLRYVLNGV
jgi:hypothetical protein